MMGAHGRGRSPEVVGGRGWPLVASKTAENTASHTAHTHKVEAALGLHRTSCVAFGGCPWW